MTQLDSTEFKIQTQTLFPTNGVGGITAADLRLQMDNLADSISFITAQSSAPSVDDDDADTAGNGVFQPGHLWVDETNNHVYVCLDNATGAADWIRITSRRSIISVVADRNLLLSDASGIIEIDTSSGAVALTIRADADLEFPIGTEINVTLIDSSNAATIETPAGVEINGSAPAVITVTASNFSTVRLYKRAADSWVASGDLA